MLQQDYKGTISSIATGVEETLRRYADSVLGQDERLLVPAPPEHFVVGYISGWRWQHDGSVETYFPKRRTFELYSSTGTFSVKLTDEALASIDSAGNLEHTVACLLCDEVLTVIHDHKRRLMRLSPRFRLAIWDGCSVKAEQHLMTYTTEIALMLRFRPYVCGPLFEEAEVLR